MTYEFFKDRQSVHAFYGNRCGSDDIKCVDYYLLYSRDHGRSIIYCNALCIAEDRKLDLQPLFNGHIVKSFFRSFKQNFLQATVIWLIMLVVIAALFVDWRLTRMNRFPMVYVVLMYMAIGITYLVFLYVFPVLSHYSNTIRGTFKTAFIMSILGIITVRTIIMAIVAPIAFVALYFIGYPIIPVVLVLCFSGPGLIRARLYSGIFEVYEKKAQSSGSTSDKDSAADPEEKE